MLPVVVTLILLITSFEINEIDGFLRDRRNRQGMLQEMPDEIHCKIHVDEAFLTFVKAFRRHYSIIIGNIRELLRDFVSVFSSSFML